VREAARWRCRWFDRIKETGPRAVLTGVRGRVRVNDLWKRDLRSATDGIRLAGLRKRRRRERSTSGWCGLSIIDGTRVICRQRGTGASAWARVEDASTVLAAVFVPASDEFFFARARRGCYAQRCSGCAKSARMGFSRWKGGPSPHFSATQPVIRTSHLHPRE